jgi:hypothetical protein
LTSGGASKGEDFSIKKKNDLENKNATEGPVVMNLTSGGARGYESGRRTSNSYSPSAYGDPEAPHTSAYVSIRQHTSAYVSIRQHTPLTAHTPAYVSTSYALWVYVEPIERMAPARMATLWARK